MDLVRACPPLLAVGTGLNVVPTVDGDEGVETHCP
jgi:hypothetical protein